MPIVEPTRQYFPDSWEPGLKGLDRVTRRLMQYASLGQLDAEIQLFSGGQWPPRSEGICHSVAGIFLGIDAAHCRFAFNAENPADEAHTIGVMAHEVAHAFRAARGTHVDTPEEEELLTDVTAAYLGFSLPTTNSYRYRTSGEFIGGWVQHSWSTSATGYLPPQAFGYLLAVQLTTRSTEQAEVKRLLGYLEPNQRDFTRMALKACRGRTPQVAERLGLPPRHLWEAKPPLESILQPLPEFVEPPEADPEPEEEALVNAGRPVFKVPRTKAMTYAGWAGVITFVVAVGWGIPHGLFAGVIGVAIGTVWGRRTRWEVCSDSGCEALLEPGLTICPECGGFIAGSIRRSSDRLAAEDAWEDAMRAARRSSRPARTDDNERKHS